MTNYHSPPEFPRQILMLTAAIFLLAGTGGAFAKHDGNGDHDHGQSHSDSSQMKSHDSKSDHSDKHSEKMKEKKEQRAEKRKEKEEKHAEKMKEKEEKRAEKTKDKDKDKTTTTTTTAAGTPAANGGKDDLYGKGIVGPNTDLKPVPGSAAPGAAPSPTAVNTIHPIPSPVVLGSGNGIIRVSDGKGNSILIPDHGTGVTVTNAGPGHVTISNGVDSRTVAGIAFNISGARTVSVDKSLGTGPRQADGSTTVLTPNGTVTGGGDFDITPGFEAHAPGDK